jgi:putative intracellular protease/amidase
MGKNVLILASNTGLWAEELQAPWDAMRKAGHKLTLATRTGKTPLPLILSMDPTFVDPVQKYAVNPVDVVERTKQILKEGEWANPIKIEAARMEDFDAIVIVGGPGAPLDLTGNSSVHRLLEEAYRTDKIIGALCYAVGALVWARNRDNDDQSIIYGKTVVAHPREWDFTGDLPYPLYGATAENPGTNLVTPGFVYPLKMIVQDAVGPNGRVLSDPTTSRTRPQVAFDYPFVTALSVESSIALGDKMVEVLATEPSSGRKFFRKHMSFFYRNDIEGLTLNDYHEDATLTAPEFTVKGHEAIRRTLKGYVEMVGDVRIKTVDRFIETESAIFLEATCHTSKAGLRRVFDIFVMRDGKISQHFTGVK